MLAGLFLWICLKDQKLRGAWDPPFCPLCSAPFRGRGFSGFPGTLPLAGVSVEADRVFGKSRLGPPHAEIHTILGLFMVLGFVP